ncbi:choice-of-anchor D domain-containing protein [Desulfoluna sp.]|uniref:choice-of-anchor D domain-containing protein n=1 Tax=Desulfoluna sp. TaxID=2045199 RepID=UPI0026219A5B|nr:choice-of-anchor D domain-containing protein [Desulfoluna sp.]
MRHHSIKAMVLLLGLTITVSAHAFTNGQEATYVLGQPDFVSNSEGTTSTTFNNVRDIALDLVHKKLYVADKDNHRVLRFAYPITANQPAAECVFGQPDFVSGIPPTEPRKNTFLNPFGITVDSSGRLWVSSGDHRVVWFNNAHLISSNQPDADGVLGQPDFTSNAGGLTQKTMNSPMGIDIDINGTLYVSEADNNRVLRFDHAASKANGAGADGVLGQPDFTTNTAATDQSTLSRPIGVRVYGTTLFVGDRSNGRILRFDHAASKANGAEADGVLGQADFTTNAGTITQNTLHAAGKMAIGGTGQLMVADGFDADRVIIFNDVLSKANGADADGVLGQPDFTSSGTGLAQNRLNMDSHGGGLTIDSSTNTLFVCDDNNNRVMVFVGTLSGPEFNLKKGAHYLPEGSRVDFGSAQSEATFTIENPGDTNLSFEETPIITLTGTDADQFSVLTQPTSPVPPLSSTTFSVRFRPTTLGDKTANISITSNDSDENPFRITLTASVPTVPTYSLTVKKSGTGTGTVSSSPAGIDCGTDCDHFFDIDTSVALTTSPATGSAFDGWSGEGITGTNSYQMITTDLNRTVTATFNVDTDIDGISNTVEDAGPNQGDGNNNGTLDSVEDHVATFLNTESEYVTLVSTTGTNLSGVSAQENPSEDDEPNVTFPSSFYEFSIVGLTAGSAHTVTLYLPLDPTLDTYYKYGPEPGITSAHWYKFEYNGTTGAKIEHTKTQTVITLHFVDGQRGDDDLSANGIVVDIGAPASKNQGSGGCFINSL